jgi:alkylhydroperoxidase family enzyme
VTGPIDELRDLALAAPEPEAALAQYVATVSAGAYAVTDADVEALKQAGVSEERIFEATASVAIGEGLRRLDAAFAVIA